MSEFRQDLVSGDWIIMVPERSKRPHDFLPVKKPRRPSPLKTCPFEDLKKSGNWPPVLIHSKKGKPSSQNWDVVVIPNKYPYLTHQAACAVPRRHGPFRTENGVGRSDLVVTRDHYKNFSGLSSKEAIFVFKIFQKRCRMLKKDRCLLYSLAFFNWGPTAGGTIYHPHYQMLTLPIIPPDVEHSLAGSQRYFKSHRRCVHCDMLTYEKKEKKRIVAENRSAIALAPFVSRIPYEVRIFPKKHLSFFEKTDASHIKGIAMILQKVLGGIRGKLKDPDLNFFIHTSPLKNQNRFRHYHWHIEITPKITIRGGFEMGTDVLVNVVDPDKAAKLLRGK